MNALFDVVFIGALLAAAIIYPLYFFELSKLKDALKKYDPDLWVKLGVAHGSQLAIAYKALNDFRDGKVSGLPISSESKVQLKKTKLLLYAGASVFLIFLFLGLTDAMIAKGP